MKRLLQFFEPDEIELLISLLTRAKKHSLTGWITITIDRGRVKFIRSTTSYYPYRDRLGGQAQEEDQ